MQTITKEVIEVRKPIAPFPKIDRERMREGLMRRFVAMGFSEEEETNQIVYLDKRV